MEDDRGTLREPRFVIPITAVATMVVLGFGWGTAYMQLRSEDRQLRGEIESLHRDLALRDTFQAEMKQLRDSIENAAHTQSAINDKIHDDHITVIREALARKGINVN